MREFRFRWYWLTETEVVVALAILAGDIIGAAFGTEGALVGITSASVVAGFVLVREKSGRDGASRPVGPPVWFRAIWIVIIAVLICC